jgi:hypothetical protein
MGMNISRMLLVFFLLGSFSLTLACGGSGTGTVGSSKVCTAVTVPTNQQLQNPVALLSSSYNNGTVIQLPAITAVPDDGEVSKTGALVFGIGTAQNNSMPGGTSVFHADVNGYFTTTYQSTSLAKSFIDSGSNVLSFPNLAPTISKCSQTSTFTDKSITSFYCPNTPLPLSAINAGSNTVSFSIANAETLFSANNSGNAAFDNIGTQGSSESFDWGVPFFFGRNVFTAIAGASTVNGVGPYWAYVSNNTVASSAPNVQTVAIGAATLADGTPGIVNGLYTSITVCVPGSSTCVSVPNILVDTGSPGLRIISSALSGLALPQSTVNGSSLTECVQFVDNSWVWGSVRTADIKLGDGTIIASAVPIQVIGDSAFPTAPSACGSTAEAQNTPQEFGANGLLGIGFATRDSAGQYFGCR